jgi:3'(2'), 5'-bisphosphate nucleotidase
LISRVEDLGRIQDALDTARVILARFTAGKIEHRSKAGGSPVTEADLAVNDALRESLPRDGEGWLSEETTDDPHRLKCDRTWVVDPIDGTIEFVRGVPEWCVSVALVENGRPIAGVVHAPALAMTWVGVADPAGPARAVFSNTDQPPMDIRVRPIPEDGAVVVASRRHGSGEEMDKFLADYKVKEMVNAGSSLKFCLVATGRADLYPRFGRTLEWDTAAGHAVLLAAGGKVLTVDGKPLAYGKPGFENPHFFALGEA